MNKQMSVREFSPLTLYSIHFYFDDTYLITSITLEPKVIFKFAKKSKNPMPFTSMWLDLFGKNTNCVIASFLSNA